MNVLEWRPDQESGRRWLLPASLALVAVSLLALLWVGSRDEDEARIDESISEVARLASARDLNGVLGFVSPSYRSSDTGDRRALSLFLANLFRGASWSEVVVSQRSTSVSGDRATSEITAMLIGGARGQEASLTGSAQKIQLEWAREDGTWRVVSSNYRRAKLKDFFSR